MDSKRHGDPAKGIVHVPNSRKDAEREAARSTQSKESRQVWGPKTRGQG